jgi:hypothetical protein
MKNLSTTWAKVEFFLMLRVVGYIKSTVKLTLEQAMKAQKWSKGIALLFLDPRR